MSDVLMPNSGAKTFADHEESAYIETAGDYEVTLTLAEPRSYGENGSTLGLFLMFKVRSDIDQPEKGKLITEKIWLDKDPDWAGWFEHKKMHKLILTQTNPKLDFQNCDEAVQYINGLNMKITVISEYDEHYDKNICKVKGFSYAKSEATAATVADPMVKTDDLPF